METNQISLGGFVAWIAFMLLFLGILLAFYKYFPHEWIPDSLVKFVTDLPIIGRDHKDVAILFIEFVPAWGVWYLIYSIYRFLGGPTTLY